MSKEFFEVTDNTTRQNQSVAQRMTELSQIGFSLVQGTYQVIDIGGLAFHSALMEREIPEPPSASQSLPANLPPSTREAGPSEHPSKESALGDDIDEIDASYHRDPR